MKDNAAATPLEALIVAQRLLHGSNPDQIDADIERALALIATASEADRACIFMIKDTVFLANTHEWTGHGISPVRPEAKDTHYDEGDAFWQAFERDGIYRLADTRALPPESDLRALLTRQGIKSLIAAPIRSDRHRIAGFVTLDYCKIPRNFTREEEIVLNGLATSLGAAFELTRLRRKSYGLESALADARSTVSAMVTTAPELLVEFDSEGRIVGFHQSQPMIIALAPDEVMGQALEAVLPPHAARICRHAMAQVDERGLSDSFGYSLQIGDERKRYRGHATARRYDARLSQRGYLLVVRDVTESNKLDKQVRQLGRLAELSSNIIMLMDSECRVTWINPACAERTGKSAKAAIGQNPLDVLGLSDSAPDIAQQISAALESGDVVDREVRVVGDNGLPYWLKLKMQPLRDADGQIESYTALGNDITVQKLATARALREKSKLLDASTDGIAIGDTAGRLRYLNPTLRSLLNVPHDMQAEDLRWSELCGDGCKAQMEAVAEELEVKGSWRGEIPFPDAKAPKQYFDLSITLQDDGSVLTLVRDITERKASEKEHALLREQLQIAQSRKLVAQLASAVAHDLVNLLSVIGMTAESIKIGTEPATRLGLQTIEEATQDALTLVSAMNKLGLRRSQRVSLELCHLIGQATDLLKPSLDAQIQLSLDLPGQPVEVTGDRTELMQVLINLLVNARDAIGPGQAHAGEIGLRLYAPQPSPQGGQPDIGEFRADCAYVCIEIRDNGAGMEQSVKDRIFEPHFTTKGEEGSGLGLSIVADIIRANAAALSFTAEAGTGSCVRIYWPVPDSSEQIRAGPLHGLRVLLLEEERACMSELMQALSDSGAAVTCCCAIEDAVAAVRAEADEWDVFVAEAMRDSFEALQPCEHLQEIQARLPICMMPDEDNLKNIKKTVHPSLPKGVTVISDRAQLLDHLKSIHRHRPSAKD